ncbi:hypothetical protein RHECIAT_CH0003295 [Rhizobium etli CIAT 652]|uniref:Uncharacterized protein n=1 Tax=Rhizobium etli (strain CIAT 652) TaxID=491916 RepID=B3PVM3_RHIE6|nr:hypothetical protein RHECIAT_CH0003295 [Rhizobium etli CIAT 652]
MADFRKLGMQIPDPLLLEKGMCRFSSPKQMACTKLCRRSVALLLPCNAPCNLFLGQQEGKQRMSRETYSDDEIYWDVMTAVGWIDDAGNPIDNDEVEDRFNTRYLVRAASDGSEFPHNYTVAERGLENLSLHDAVNLGFTTSEYQTALRFSLLEGREITSEDELAELTSSRSRQKWNFR